MRKTEQMASRILRQVTYEPNLGCWLWTGRTTPKGYGQIRRARLPAIGAHRASYECFVGPVTHDQLVLHKCDVPACVNPEHLFLGTARDNIHDSLRKGRRRLGEDHPNSRLTEEIVREILTSTEKNLHIAKRLGLRHQLVGMIRARRTWRHISA